MPLYQKNKSEHVLIVRGLNSHYNLKVYLHKEASSINNSLLTFTFFRFPCAEMSTPQEVVM